MQISRLLIVSVPTEALPGERMPPTALLTTLEMRPLPAKVDPLPIETMELFKIAPSTTSVPPLIGRGPA